MYDMTISVIPAKAGIQLLYDGNYKNIYSKNLIALRIHCNIFKIALLEQMFV